MTHNRNRRRDRGTVLPLVMVVTVVMSLVILALARFVTTDLKYAQVTEGRPSKVFLKIGTNDLGTGVPEDEIVANLAEILDRIAAESPGTGVYVQSVLPRQASYRERIESLMSEAELEEAERLSFDR